MTDLKSFQTQKAAEFETDLAYKFDHRQGCSFFSDAAKGPMCTCGVMKDAIDFLNTAIAEAWVSGEIEGMKRGSNMLKDNLEKIKKQMGLPLTTRITAMSPEGGTLEVEEKV